MDHDPPVGAGRKSDPEFPHPLLGTAPSQRRSRFSGFTLTRERVLQVAAIVVLLILGSLLPYLSMPYITNTIELAQMEDSLFPAAQFIRGIEPRWLPDYDPAAADQQAIALNFFNVGPSLQQIGVVVALITCLSLFQDEINKFFWWPLHLSGWMLALSPAVLFIGLSWLHRTNVSISLGIGWLPIAVAGVLILIATFRARSRIDTYASI